MSDQTKYFVIYTIKSFVVKLPWRQWLTYVNSHILSGKTINLLQNRMEIEQVLISSNKILPHETSLGSIITCSIVNVHGQTIGCTINQRELNARIWWKFDRIMGLYPQNSPNHDHRFFFSLEYSHFCHISISRITRIDFLGVQNPQNVDFLNLIPLNPLTKTTFLAHFVTKSGPFGRFGGCVAPPASGLCLTISQEHTNNQTR